MNVPPFGPMHALRDALLERAPLHPRTHPQLRQALEYALGSLGSLSRARMVMLAAEAHALAEDTTLHLACAVEYYHLASLILDDLPCMDDAALRRGRPALHRIHGEATAILAALALINRAYTLVSLALEEQPGIVRSQCDLVLDVCLGSMGILDGQSRDLAFSAGPRTLREAFRIAVQKTGCLVSLAIFLPALIARPSPEERLQLKALCTYWGLAYQAADDLKDVLATDVEAGKPTQRDQLLNRPNIAWLGGVPRAHAHLRRMLALAERKTLALCALGSRWAYLLDLHRAMFDPSLARSDAA